MAVVLGEVRDRLALILAEDLGVDLGAAPIIRRASVVRVDRLSVPVDVTFGVSLLVSEAQCMAGLVDDDAAALLEVVLGVEDPAKVHGLLVFGNSEYVGPQVGPGALRRVRVYAHVRGGTVGGALEVDVGLDRPALHQRHYTVGGPLGPRSDEEDLERPPVAEALAAERYERLALVGIGSGELGEIHERVA